MLLAVEGGFFSSSASGCSEGFTFLLLGHKTEDQPMRVSPLSPYELVAQGPSPDLDSLLASAKKRLSRGCASIIPSSCASSQLDSPSPDHQKAPSDPADPKIKEEHERSVSVISLKSVLKRTSIGAPGETTEGNLGQSKCSGEVNRRKVQWIDVYGRELVEIREFEPSETCDSDGAESGCGRSCNCVIM